MCLFIHSTFPESYWVPAPLSDSFSNHLCPQGGSIKSVIPRPSVWYRTLGNTGWVHWISQESPFMSGIVYPSPDPFCKEQGSGCLLCITSPPLRPSSRPVHSKGTEAYVPCLQGAEAWRQWGAWFLTLDRARGEKQSCPVLLLLFRLCLSTHGIKIRNCRRSEEHSEGVFPERCNDFFFPPLQLRNKVQAAVGLKRLRFPRPDE